ncbi:Innexin, partial [Ancylostoma duodenale]
LLYSFTFHDFSGSNCNILQVSFSPCEGFSSINRSKLTRNYLEIDLPTVTVALRNEAKKIRDPLNIKTLLKPARKGWFMGAGNLHGLRVVVDALNGRQWKNSGNFPRVTFCDLEVRELGGAVHRWSLQCVLMINMFNEKIFVFLWWWFCMLLFVSILNLFRWIIRLSFDSQRAFVTAVLAAEFLMPLWEEFMSAKAKVE